MTPCLNLRGTTFFRKNFAQRFETVYDLYAPIVYGNVLHAAAGDVVIAQEITAGIFLEIYKEISSGQSRTIYSFAIICRSMAKSLSRRGLSMNLTGITTAERQIFLHLNPIRPST